LIESDSGSVSLSSDQIEELPSLGRVLINLDGSDIVANYQFVLSASETPIENDVLSIKIS
jgi:hypothetical protein